MALEAGDRILRFRIEGAKKRRKVDGSLVTEADIAASEIITKALSDAFPDIPVICEEGEKPDFKTFPEAYWLVDPIDGTIQFAQGKDEFTVNIGLIYQGKPILGVLYHPPTEDMLVGFENMVFAGKRDQLNILTPRTPEHAILLGSKLEQSESLQDYMTKKNLLDYALIVQKSSLKFTSLIYGKASFWYRSRASSEWDTAAGHAILLAAGGKVLTFDGNPLIYGKEGFENQGFIAFAPGIQ